MDFKKAVGTCARFVGGEGITQRIRGVPRTPPIAESKGFPARLYATDGLVSVLCDLDEDLDVPNATFDSKLLAKIAREGRITSMAMVEYGAVQVKVGASTYTLEDCGKPHNSVANFPGFPALPADWNAEPGWAEVERVLHAASKDEDDPQLMAVHFAADGWVSATDKSRVARVRPDAPVRAGLVPIKLFKHWPKREVFSAFSPTTAYFRIGLDELRFAHFVRGVFPDLNAFVPAVHEGHEAIVRAEDFRAACKRASALSPIKFVSLDFAPGTLTVKAWNQHPQTFAVTLACETLGTCSMTISGPHINEALQEFDTPHLWLGYSQANKPLRLEGPSEYVELIFPMTLQAADTARRA